MKAKIFLYSIDQLKTDDIIEGKKERKKMKNTKIIMNREELNNVLYENHIELDTLVDTEYAIGGELLMEAKGNGNMIEYFFPMGDEGEFIEVNNDGYVINDGIYR